VELVVVGLAEPVEAPLLQVQQTLAAGEVVVVMLLMALPVVPELLFLNGYKGLNMETKIYRLYGIDTAMNLLRPGAKWEWTGGVGFTRWEDPRPKPTVQEVEETMEKIKAFEDSINTVWLPEQIAEITGQQQKIAEAIGG
jgi:hypothetical protein